MKTLLVLLLLIIITSIKSNSIELTQKWINSGILYDVTSLKISPDGRYLAIGDSLYWLKIYDIEQKRIVQEFKLFRADVLAFSEDSKSIFVQSYEGLFKIDIFTGKTINSTFSYDKDKSNLNYAFTFSDETIAIVYYNEDFQTGKYPYISFKTGIFLGDFKREKWTFYDKKQFYDVNPPLEWNIKRNSAIDIFSKENKIAIANDSGFINVYYFIDNDSLELSKQIKYDSIGLFVSIKFSGDGKELVSTHKDGAIRIWSVESGKIIYENKKVPKLAKILSKRIIDDKIIIKYTDEKVKYCNFLTFYK